jgi:ribonuclease HI
VSVFEAELTGIILALEYVASHSWQILWMESDLTSVVQAFKNVDIIPYRLRNQWHNCFHLGIQSICSHIYREGNCCADKLAEYGHSDLGIVWLG